MIRCLECGCSRLDSEGCTCAFCGGSLGVREERCYITEDTKAKLMAHSEDLKSLGVYPNEEIILGKSFSDGLALSALVLQVAESLQPGALRKLILYLREIAIPKEEILRLRLDEPEQVLEVLSSEEPNNGYTSL